MQNTEWCVAVFTARESLAVLLRTLDTLVSACAQRATVIDLLVNGNSPLSKEAANAVDKIDINPNVAIRVWHFPAPEKAETWNRYLHDIWIGSEVTFFVDGYVAVEPNALSGLAHKLISSPNANCATGVPSVGWTAKSLRRQMLLNHGIHGNLYALPRRVVTTLRSLGFRLPREIYRNDGVLGAVLAFSMDPAKNDWCREKLLIVPEVTWHLPKSRWWTLESFRMRWRRRISQARGDFEIQAIRQHLAIDRRAPADLPGTTRELIVNWVEANPTKAHGMIRFSWPHRKALASVSLYQGVPGDDERPKLLKSRNAPR